jgi:hydroxymethylbilane synthase
MPFTLRIGSRPSALAIVQAELIKGRLQRANSGIKAEIVPISTTGDKLTDASLAQVGGKGLFIRELEQALAGGRIDIAVHSMKDLPAELPQSYRIVAVPERENPRDALITRAGGGWDTLPRAARLGTSSPRRRLEALRLRPDLRVAALRGNVDTRLKRLSNRDFDAIILAMAGLTRLNLRDNINLVELNESDFVPAGGQGALAIEALSGQRIGASDELERALNVLNDMPAMVEVTAERSFLATIGASCVSPVGVRGSVENGALRLRALLFSVDGTRSLADEIAAPQVAGSSTAADHNGAKQTAAALGAALGHRMIAQGAAEMIGRE